ncbi:uncharacterized protein [Miscanthus floridulus]|uniref:uncharacterized protein isoform X2 n=1 Tax=Miscanthus floridulus TaxID=154761 RepID=UPI003458007D
MREALCCAAKARAAAPPPPVHSDNTADHQDARAALLHEAAVVVNLHAQAVSVQNILSLVPVVLDLSAGNYNKWRGHFLITLGMFGLCEHVLSDDPDIMLPDWSRIVCVVLSWLYGTISADLVEIVMAPATTACTVWLALEDQFVGNRETRALYLDAEFRNFLQGDLSVTDYCRRLKGMADALGDLGKPVQDRTLVLNLIRGLNEKFAVIGMHLQRARPFPSFLVARNDLLLEELNLAKRSSTSSAFVAVPGTGQLLNQHSSGAPPPQKKTPGGQQAAAASGSTGPTSWAPSFLNPWAGTIQMCPGPRPPPLAPLPQARSPASVQQPSAPQPHCLFHWCSGAGAKWLLHRGFWSDSRGIWSGFRGACQLHAPSTRVPKPLCWRIVLGSASTCQYIQYHVPPTAMVLRLRCHQPHDLQCRLLPITIPLLNLTHLVL